MLEVGREHSDLTGQCYPSQVTLSTCFLIRNWLIGSYFTKTLGSLGEGVMIKNNDLKVNFEKLTKNSNHFLGPSNLSFLTSHIKPFLALWSSRPPHVTLGL